MKTNVQWFAIKVLPHYQQQTTTALRLKALEAFSTPLFPGHVFCRFEYVKRIVVVNTPGVIEIVSNTGSPAPISDEEIAALQAALTSGAPIQPWPYARGIQPVKVVRGALKNFKGFLLQTAADCRLILNLTAIARSVAVNIDPNCVNAVETAG